LLCCGEGDVQEKLPARLQPWSPGHGELRRTLQLKSDSCRVSCTYMHACMRQCTNLAQDFTRFACEVRKEGSVSARWVAQGLLARFSRKVRAVPGSWQTLKTFRCVLIVHAVWLWHLSNHYEASSGSVAMHPPFPNRAHHRPSV
jgi:hypothetical protein